MTFIRFLQDRRGAIAPIFAVALVPLVALTGAAIDYSRANSVRSSMQASLDAAALALSKDVTNLNSSQISQEATNVFLANFNRPEASGVTVTATYTTNPSTIVVNGSGSIQTDFMKLLGVSSINVSTSSTVTWGMTRLRVALVLDNTGSMADNNKINALKTATNNLLSQLSAAASSNGDVYVSIVPFVKDVNVDSVNYNANWIYWGNSSQDPTKSDQASWDANNGSCSIGSASTRSSCTSQGSCSISGNTSQGSCTSAGTCSISGKTSQSSCTSAGTCSISGHTTQSSCQSAHVCSKSQYTTQSQCTNHGGAWDAGVWTLGVWTTGVWTQATWTAANHNTWNGCVMDRGNSATPDTTGNYDTNIAAPNSTIMSTLYPAEQYNACPQALMALSYNWSSMTTLVNNMSPNGNTNQAIGLQLGWMSLVGGGPFPPPPAMDPNYTYTQVIILLTDGLNTQDRWYSVQGSIDARQQLTCNNIKASGITLYTIQVNTGGDPTSTLLQNCASDSTKFFLLTSSTQIVTTFNQIGTNLSQLRISK